MLPVVRGTLARWSLLVAIRLAASAAEGRRGRSLLALAHLLALCVGAYLMWLVTGRGPWLTFGMNVAPVAVPRGVPDGAFWRRDSGRWPPAVWRTTAEPR